MKKKYLTIILVLTTISVYSTPKLGYKKFLLGMQKSEAINIIKKNYKVGHTINYNAKNEKDNNIIEIKHNKIHNKVIFLYFNEKDVLYTIIIWAGYMNKAKYSVLIKKMIKKYKEPFRKLLNKNGYPHLGWTWENYKYMIQCFYEADIETVLITYTNRILRDEYNEYLYKVDDY